MNNPESREEIARAGQIRTLNEHTFEKRAAVFDRIVREALR